MSLEDKTEQALEHFNAITTGMQAMFKRKNQDYGNSFEKSLDEDGLLVLKIRIGDKFNRLSSLIKNPDKQQIAEESLTDTLLDLANYAVMGIMWMQNQYKYGE